jgi:hypothetical protein
MSKKPLLDPKLAEYLNRPDNEGTKLIIGDVFQYPNPQQMAKVLASTVAIQSRKQQASLGGKGKSRKSKIHYAEWQRRADEYWSSPKQSNWPKETVAALLLADIEKELNEIEEIFGAGNDTEQHEEKRSLLENCRRTPGWIAKNIHK